MVVGDRAYISKIVVSVSVRFYSAPYCQQFIHPVPALRPQARGTAGVATSEGGMDLRLVSLRNKNNGNRNDNVLRT